jgi:hypothetical protein
MIHSRYFNVHYIPYTNLILVVTDGRCRCGHNATKIEGREVEYQVENSTEELCRTPELPLHRRRPGSCYNFNPEACPTIFQCILICYRLFLYICEMHVYVCMYACMYWSDCISNILQRQKSFTNTKEISNPNVVSRPKPCALSNGVHCFSCNLSPIMLKMEVECKHSFFE